jgi:hypothetical protein
MEPSPHARHSLRERLIERVIAWPLFRKAVARVGGGRKRGDAALSERKRIGKLR